jgi:hypothetical protein
MRPRTTAPASSVLAAMVARPFLSELLALATVIALLPAVLSSTDNCGFGNYPWAGPAPPRVTPALRMLNNTQYNATVCAWTFEQFEASYLNVRPCGAVALVNVMTCPEHCLRALEDPKAPPAFVLGSFPYHPSSSLCLAAIHAGLITDEAGGGFFLDRFYPETWNGDDTQSIFPHGSYLGSLSNGVQSEEVMGYTPPSFLSEYSVALRPRGFLASQRQTAPFSPRAGHLAVNIIRNDPSMLYIVLVIGGRDDSRYYNGQPHSWPSPHVCRLTVVEC